MAFHNIATLRIESPGAEEKTVKLRDGQSFTIGRDQANDLTVGDPGVSRFHATFSATRSGLVVTDLCSLNGTFVNGERIQNLRTLTGNDVVDVGAVKVRVRLPTGEHPSLDHDLNSRAMTVQLNRIDVTVLVATIHNYRALVSSNGAEYFTQLFNGWSAAARLLVESSGGKVDKIVGASMVANWVGKDGAALARTAFETARGARRLGVDAGLEVSTVLTSGEGLETNQRGENQFAILGDHTALALTIEELAGRGKERFLLSEETAELLGGGHQFERSTQYRIKGRELEIKVFPVHDSAT